MQECILYHAVIEPGVVVAVILVHLQDLLVQIPLAFLLLLWRG
jgi:hypothetical protein